MLRLQAKGGSITNDDVARVEGVLAVTRAFGNNAMKTIVDAEPDVCTHSIAADDLAVVIASDGVWDVLSNDDAVCALVLTVQTLGLVLMVCSLSLAARMRSAPSSVWQPAVTQRPVVCR